jgi:hypothetical protein
MILAAEMTCPYCGHKNTIRIDTNTTAPERFEFLTCFLDDGGCDRTFVFMYKVSLATEVRRIEGIG